MAPDPPGFFPPSLTIPPLTPPHKQTFILLHGRGSSASKFGPPFLSTVFRDPAATQKTTITLQTAFPNAKFVFPVAPRSRATIYKRSIINQWFDSWHMDLDPDLDTSIDTDALPYLYYHHHHHQEQQQQQKQQQGGRPRRRQNKYHQLGHEEWRAVDGLRETVAHLHGRIREEAALVGGSGNVFLGGISQGCAAGLVTMLLWEGEKLGGYLGICGWLPFERAVRRAIDDGVHINREEGGESAWEDDFDPFEREESDGEDEPVDVAARAVKVLRESLEWDDNSPTFRPLSFDTPILLGHGTEDTKVPIARGREAAECLKAAGLDASWKEYHGLGHWYSAEMLTDMTSFLRSRAGCESE
ncbi:hypothetical protein MFIFM68171_05034 [Madurella fahalii]|uniref:Phospholipase/carboxylesterase/thioesterase domain-containing protein n=1 Tax=Madurella fahalii TaxID=1157608 RepID=A0ABQ0GAS9_9PEZI